MNLSISGFGPGSLRQPLARAFICLLAVLAALPCSAERVTKLSSVHILYVDSFGPSKRAVELRKQVLHRLERSHEIKITDDPDQADALLKGTGQALLDSLRWRLSAGQKSCSSLGYAPLPAGIAATATQMVEQFLKD